MKKRRQEERELRIAAGIQGYRDDQFDKGKILEEKLNDILERYILDDSKVDKVGRR